MKKFLNKYIFYYFIPFYKRLAPKFKSLYNKFQYWRYDIKSESTEYHNKENNNGILDVKILEQKLKIVHEPFKRKDPETKV